MTAPPGADGEAQDKAGDHPGDDLHVLFVADGRGDLIQQLGDALSQSETFCSMLV